MDTDTAFEQERGRLRTVAYRMLGSLSDADDAVQEAWLRLHRTEATEIENLPAWLTTVTGRICLDMLRSRTSRREQPLGVHLPDPVVTPAEDAGPEHEALLADSVGLALLIVLDTLTPAERLAFVLHDMFAVPYAEIGPTLGRSPAAAKQLASRARQRVRGAAPRPEMSLRQQRGVVDAFVTASRNGDIETLVALLDPDVVARSDGGRARPGLVTVGAQAVASQAATYARLAEETRAALVNGVPGLVAYAGGRPVAVMSFVTANARITEINILNDPERLSSLPLPD